MTAAANQTLAGTLTDTEIAAMIKDIDKAAASPYRRPPMTAKPLTIEECRRKFGVRDSVLMNFIPMMLATVAREEAAKLCEYSAKYRLESIKKYSRLIKTASCEYERLLRQAYGRAYDAYLSYRDRYRAEINSNVWLMELEADTICANQLPQCEHRMVPVCAIVVVMLLDYCEEYDRKVDRLIQERLNVPISRKPDSYMKMLRDLCQDIIDKQFPIQPSDTLRTWIGVLSNQAHFLVERIMDEEDRQESEKLKTT